MRHCHQDTPSRPCPVVASGHGPQNAGAAPPSSCSHAPGATCGVTGPHPRLQCSGGPVVYQPRLALTTVSTQTRRPWFPPYPRGVVLEPQLRQRHTCDHGP